PKAESRSGVHLVMRSSPARIVERHCMRPKPELDFSPTTNARLRQGRQTRMFRAMALRNVQLGTETVLTHPDLVNLYGCPIGDGTKVGPFVEIQKNSHVGVRCKISSHTFICEGVTIED